MLLSCCCWCFLFFCFFFVGGWGQYIGNTLSVPLSKCLFNCLLSATPPHRINQYWWNVTQLQYENVHEGRSSWSEINQGIIISSVGRGMSICDSTQSTSLISFNWYTCVSHDKSVKYKKESQAYCQFKFQTTTFKQKLYITSNKHTRPYFLKTALIIASAGRLQLCHQCSDLFIYFFFSPTSIVSCFVKLE